MSSVDEACTAVRRDVEQSQSIPDDLAYFTLHEKRFRHAAARIVELVSPGAEILDIGGHYLHFSSILSSLGYRVTAIDVPAHATLPFVVERAARMNVSLQPVEDRAFPDGVFLESEADRFDAVIFCEILEHITFNPTAFWRRVGELVRDRGMIYVTTPNALKLLSVLGALWNLVSLRRIGLDVGKILRTDTFGHHWKEYSASEIVEYFSRLSPDFRVAVRKVSYGPPSAELASQLGSIRTRLLTLGNATRFFADNLEAVVTVDSKNPPVPAPSSPAN
jgi:2-polyprenyl-6-hydroxyphenyl methylase/3-demethylubiquinone-9 3-methyltransferase